MTLVERARDTIRRHAMLAGGETVLVAVSGGADSVALLHVLRELVPAWNLRLSVAHVDHRLRPDSVRDAEFVRGIGERLGVPVEVLTVDVPPRGSREAAGRAVRYAALARFADHIGADRIAVAHTADDQAETVMMRVLEGTGARGLAGIPPVRGRIIRPLIELRRAEVLAELRRAGLPWVEDPSNRDQRFLRNRVRHELLPLLSKHNPEIVAALSRTAGLMRETIETVDRLAASELARSASVEPDAIVLSMERLRSLPQQVATEVLRQAAARLGSEPLLRGWAHRGLRRLLASAQPRRPFRLPGIAIEVSGDRLRLAREPGLALCPRTLEAPGSTPLPEIGLLVSAALFDSGGYVVPRSRRVVAFDADVLRTPLTVRARRRGDHFTPFGGAERQLKNFFINAKVPRWERDTIPIVEAGGHIVWVAGLRRGAAAPVTSDTVRILELSLIPMSDQSPSTTDLAQR